MRLVAHMMHLGLAAAHRIQLLGCYKMVRKMQLANEKNKRIYILFAQKKIDIMFLQVACPCELYFQLHQLHLHFHYQLHLGTTCVQLT